MSGSLSAATRGQGFATGAGNACVPLRRERRRPRIAPAGEDATGLCSSRTAPIGRRREARATESHVRRDRSRLRSRAGAGSRSTTRCELPFRSPRSGAPEMARSRRRTLRNGRATGRTRAASRTSCAAPTFTPASTGRSARTSLARMSPPNDRCRSGNAMASARTPCHRSCAPRGTEARSAPTPSMRRRCARIRAGDRSSDIHREPVYGPASPRHAASAMCPAPPPISRTPSGPGAIPRAAMPCRSASP